MDRQHTYTSLSATLPNFSTIIDRKGVDKFFSYNYNFNNDIVSFNNLNINRLEYSPDSKKLTHNNEYFIENLYKLLPTSFNKLSSTDFLMSLKLVNNSLVLGAENDSKQYANTFKFLLNPASKKKNIHNLNYTLSNTSMGDSFNTNIDPTSNFNYYLYNTDNTLKFKDYKSSNAQFLGSERTVRLLTNLNSNSYK
jgi:hypothetical protein